MGEPMSVKEVVLLGAIRITVEACIKQLEGLLLTGVTMEQQVLVTKMVGRMIYKLSRITNLQKILVLDSSYSFQQPLPM